MEHKNHSQNGNYLEERILNAVSLIGLGVIFLLNTTGVVEWSAWLNLLRFWPLFLIFGGLSVLVSTSRIGKFLVSLSSLVVFLGLMLLSAKGVQIDSLPWFSVSEINYSQNITTQDSASAKERDLNIKLPMGELTLSDQGASDSHLDINAVYYDQNQKPNLQESLSGDKLEIDFKTNERNFRFGSFKSPVYDFVLGQSELLTNINLELGAGNSIIRLEDSNINSLKVENGAGNLEIDLGMQALPKQIDLKSGAGNIDLAIPEGAAIQVNYQVGLGNVEIDGQSFGNNDNGKYESGTGEKITINVEVGLGNINIFYK
jgi:hypothetical protein